MRLTRARLEPSSRRPSKAVALAVIVAALGYFVDIYDLLLFSIVRVASLKDLGLRDGRGRHIGRRYCIFVVIFRAPEDRRDLS